ETPTDQQTNDQPTETGNEPATGETEANETPTDQQTNDQPTETGSEPATGETEANETPTDQQTNDQPTETGSEPATGETEANETPTDQQTNDQPTETGNEPATGETEADETPTDQQTNDQPTETGNEPATGAEETPPASDDGPSPAPGADAGLQSEQSVENGDVITADEVADLVLMGNGADPATPLWLTFTDANGAIVGPVQAVVDHHGNWESPSVDLSELQDGAVAVSMEEVDASGELVPAGATTLHLQTELPSTEQIVPVSDPVTGNLLGDEVEVLNNAPSGQLSIGAINGEPLTPDEPITLPSGATLTVNADGSFEYEAGEAYADLPPGQLAADTFSYTVVDGDGNESPGTFVVNMTGVSSNPTAHDDVIATSVDTPVTVAVLDNDSSVDGQTLSVVILSDSGLGTATVNGDGSITFTPNPGVTGTARIDYLVETDDGRTDTATLHVDVVPAFQFDSINDFSQGFATGSSSPGQFRPLASRPITTLTPDPVFTGTARPGSSVIARVYDEAGELVTEQQGETDQSGHWLLQARGLDSQTNYSVDFAYAGGGSQGYGDFSVEASTHTYRPGGSASQWGLTDWARRQFDSLQQMHDDNGNPLEF
ncbi:MAG: Ig-like domain-containing protein, partial [Planctomycetaceae bacterium]|nr:Ig-like domain-containing protein [Planctomycetaceae bacterium]